MYYSCNNLEVNTRMHCYVCIDFISSWVYNLEEQSIFSLMKPSKFS
ncbi:mCG1033215 [Mus musculus]|nr:mCG1033215 [Mus musculus]